MYKNEGHPVRCIDCYSIPFTDGTVAGTDVTKNIVFWEQTYYGNGCDNGWSGEDPPAYGGSGVSCSTRIVKTLDGEDLQIGTYYSFVAANAGTGGDGSSTDNSNPPDTFCPLGWQMPYGGSGGDYYDQSRSWKYLFTRYNIQYNQQGIVKMKSFPLSYISSGVYITNAGLYRMSDMGYFYSSTVYNYKTAYGMRVTILDHGPDTPFDVLAGVSLRCGVGLAT